MPPSLVIPTVVCAVRLGLVACHMPRLTATVRSMLRVDADDNLRRPHDLALGIVWFPQSFSALSLQGAHRDTTFFIQLMIGVGCSAGPRDSRHARIAPISVL